MEYTGATPRLGKIRARSTLQTVCQAWQLPPRCLQWAFPHPSSALSHCGGSLVPCISLAARTEQSLGTGTWGHPGPQPHKDNSSCSRRLQCMGKQEPPTPWLPAGSGSGHATSVPAPLSTMATCPAQAPSPGPAPRLGPCWVQPTSFPLVPVRSLLRPYSSWTASSVPTEPLSLSFKQRPERKA